MATMAVATANAHVLTHCPARAAIVARTCLALADAVRCEWPRTAVAIGRVAEAGVLAVERLEWLERLERLEQPDEHDHVLAQLDELARLARPERLPIEILRRATALGQFDTVGWFFTVSDAIDADARAALMDAGRSHLLPRHLWTPDVRELVQDALMLTDAVIDAWIALEPDLARHRESFHHRHAGCWATLCMMSRTGCNRPSGERWTMESAKRRFLLPFCAAQLVADVEPASSEYTVEMRVVDDDVAITVAPIYLLKSRVELVFTAPGSFDGPFRAHVTTYVLPSPKEWPWPYGVFRGDGVLFRGGHAERCTLDRERCGA